MKLPRSLLLTLSAVLACLLLCSCSGIPFKGTAQLLDAPRLSGELYDIQQSLESSISTAYTLKYPSSGDYRSAIILQDITGDGKNEAVAFYSNTSEGVTAMNINLVISHNGKWKSVAGSHVYASDVEQVMFRDLNNDGVQEIIVGWLVSGTSDKQLVVYSYENGVLVQRIQEKYSVFISYNPDSDDLYELLLIYLDTVASSSKATLYKLTGKGIATEGNCILDGSVSSYSEPIASTLSGGRPAVYLDAVKGAGMITEIIYMEDGLLKNAAYDSAAGASTLTYRPSTVSVVDINGDSVPEIPMQTLFKGMDTVSDSEKVYTTRWCDYGPNGLTVVLTACMNYADFYRFELPAGWLDGVTAIKDSKKRLRTFLIWNSEENKAGEMLLQLRAVSAEDWGDGSTLTADGYVEIARTDKLVYAARTGNSDSNLAITIDQVRNAFKIIDWE